MAYRYANRNQLQLLPACIEDYISLDNPVRAYDAFIEALNLKELGLNLDPIKWESPIPPQGDVKAFSLWVCLWDRVPEN